jgi:hypothetical protein
MWSANTIHKDYQKESIHVYLLGSLILSTFLVALIDFANFQVNGASHFGLSGSLDWDAVNNWFIPIMLIWFLCMHIQAVYHYYDATYPNHDDEIDEKYISGIKEAYEVANMDILIADSKIDVYESDKATVDVMKNVVMLKIPFLPKVWTHLRIIARLSIRDYRIAADVMPVLAAILLLLKRFILLIL